MTGPSTDGQLTAIAGCIRGLIFELDHELRFLHAWADEPALLARPPEQLVGRTIDEALGPEAGAPFTALVRRVFATGESEHIEYVLDVQSGKRWFSGGAKRVDAPGGGTTVVFVAHDVTAQKEMEQALRESEERYRSIFANDPLAKWVIDRETHRYLHVNESALRQYGYTRDEFLRMTIADLRPEEDVPRAKDAMTRVGGGATNFGIFRHRRKDGALIEAEVSGHAVALDGRSVVVASARDVTEEQRLKRVLVESEQRYRTLFEASSLPMWLWDPASLLFVDVNRAAIELYGWSRDEFLQKTIASVVAGDAADVASRLRAGVERPFRGDTRHFRKDGTTIAVRVDATHVHLDGRRLVFSAIADVTDRDRLQAELLHAQKMEAIGHLAGGIAHDFNNVLAVILSDAQFLLESVAPDTELAESATAIATGAQRAAALTRQLLLFSRRQSSTRVILDLNARVTGLERLLRRLVGEDVQLKCDLDPALGAVDADPGELEQVVMNLVVNARDAMAHRGTVTLRTFNHGADVAFSVADTGCGMDARTQARIFEPFFTTKAPGQGTGLGLSTTFGIVQRAGGRITVETAPGEGSTFTVILPRAQPPAAERPRSVRPAPPAGTETVLVVEDDEALIRVVTRVLRARGYKVLTADRAAEAYEIAADLSTPLDLVLTDVVMPGGDGLTLSRRIRAVRPEVPVLFMSGYTDRAQEVVPLLPKPFTPDQLAGAVRDALSEAPPPSLTTPGPSPPSVGPRVPSR